MRRGWYVVALLALVLCAGWGPYSHIPAGLGIPVPCTITGIDLSNTSYPAGSPSGTDVGTATSTTTGGCAVPALSLAGTDAASFSLSSGTAPAILRISGAPASPAHISIVATVAGAHITPPAGCTPGTGNLSCPFTITASGGGGAVALQRTFNNPGVGATGATAFWDVGYPFKAGEVPTGNIVTATLGGTSVPVTCLERKLAANGDLTWCHLLVDFSGKSIAGGGTAALALTAGSGSWSATTSRTNADWEALADVLTLTNLTTSGVNNATTQGSGTWVATFDGGATNTITTLGTSPLGIMVKVVAAFKDGANTNRNLTAAMYYWVAEKADTTLGPVRSWGPLIQNTQLHLTDASLSTLGAYTYDADWTRNSVSQRSYAQITTPAFGIGVMTRTDGQGDWTANDPGIWVSQSYTDVAATNKTPPYFPGVTGYSAVNPSASVTAINTSTGVITVDLSYTIFGNPNQGANGFYAQPVEVTATGLPGNLFANTVYWAAHTGLVGAKTLRLYDTQAHAITNGATGLIVPSTSGTAVQLTGVEAPGATGQYDLVLGDTGGRPDLSLTTEWGAGYLTGNTQAFQQLGRTMAYNMASMPVHAVETSTGKIPSILNAAGTPAGLGGHYELTYWGGGATPSSNINGGVHQTGGTGGWSFAGSAVAHMPSGSYIVWLMEGAPPLRDIMAQYGNGQAAGLTFATGGTLPVRNMVVSGTTYYGSSTCVGNGTNQREYAWRTLALLNLVRSSINGSDEETYGRNFLHSSLEECAAYEAYKGADYLNNGLPFYDEATIPIAGATIGSQQVSPFEIGYLAGVVGLGALMEGDYEADWTTQLNFIAKWLVYVYGGNSSPACPYYANSFDISPGLSSWGASAPASYISSLADLGLSPGEQLVTFANSGATITLPSGFSWTLATGDKFKPSNYQNSSNFQLGHTPPAPFSPGATNYIVGNPSGSTFEANTGGSSIIATGATTTQTITAASWASGTKLVTITTASPHGITNNNNTIIIAGMTPAAYNGTRGATVVNTTTFTYGLANDPGTATVMGTESPLISAWFVPSGQLTCPSGMILQHNAQAPDVYVTEHAMELAIMARAGVTGASTAYTNALNRWAGSSNAAANFATGMGWAGAP